MKIDKKVLIFCVVVLTVSLSITNADTYDPFGKIKAPTENIEQHTTDTERWVTPIGGTSKWKILGSHQTTSGYGDKDNDGGSWVWDNINDSGIKWDISASYVKFLSDDDTGTEVTVYADEDPHTSVGVRLKLDDAGSPDNDGGFSASFNPVASQNLDIVIPDKEIHWLIVTSSCSGADPFGVNKHYYGLVNRIGYTLDFDHCEVKETDTWPDWTENGCGFGIPTIGGSLQLDSDNKWTGGYDHVRKCVSVDSVIGPCTTSASLDWSIRTASGTPGWGEGAWHVYHNATYTFTAPAGGKWSSLTASRSELNP